MRQKQRLYFQWNLYLERFFSIIILHEVITLRMVIGCAIILAAVIISNLSETEGEAKDEEIQCSNF